jgi:rRNA-processing protein CGR1
MLPSHVEGSEILTSSSSNVDHCGMITKGRSVSGRSWRQPKKRASSIVTNISLNAASKSWEQKQAEKEALKATALLQKELKEQTRQAILDRKARKADQEKRRMENEFKAASRQAQQMGKHANLKMKAMNKKQLRQIKKTRMNTKTGVLEFVSAYAK